MSGGRTLLFTGRYDDVAEVYNYFMGDKQAIAINRYKKCGAKGNLVAVQCYIGGSRSICRLPKIR